MRGRGLYSQRLSDHTHCLTRLRGLPMGARAGDDEDDEDDEAPLTGSRTSSTVTRRRGDYEQEDGEKCSRFLRVMFAFCGGLLVGTLCSRVGSAWRQGSWDRVVPSTVLAGIAASHHPSYRPQRGLIDAAGRGGLGHHKEIDEMQPRRKRTPSEAFTRGPYYGDLEQPGEFERMVRTMSSRGELVLLHGDGNRLRMIVNLIANLNEHGIDHILLLGFDSATCARLKPRSLIACAHSSFLWDEQAGGDQAELAARRATWTLESRYVAWIQKFHYMRRLLERRINVLALDSDVVATTDPYPHLRGPFGRYALVTAFDTKGGFANINVGVMYIQNASVGGPVHGLFHEFERRVALALRMPPPKDAGRRAYMAPRLFWDQVIATDCHLIAI